MRRFQSRRSNGRFQRNTLENTFGLRVAPCPVCHAFNPYGLNEARPLRCPRCDTDLTNGSAGCGSEDHSPQTPPLGG